MSKLTIDRRAFLKLSAVAAAASGLPLVSGAQAAPVQTKARIVIAGAGAAGIAMASQVSRRLSGATITVIDRKATHWFQPGFTLVAAGIWDPAKVEVANAAYMPQGVEWVQEEVAAFSPETNTVATSGGRTIAYDYLIVATGLMLDYGRIEGMERGLIGKHGITSIYAGPEAARASFEVMDAFVGTGGQGVFLRPQTEMKCAGAPLKFTFLAEDRARLRGRRDAVTLHYYTPFTNLFSVAPVHTKVEQLFTERDVAFSYKHTLRAIDPGRKIATFETPEGMKEVGWDLLHLVPPMRAPDAVRNSALPWQDGPLAADGWVEVDKASLRHKRFANVFAVGDIAGVPRGKTAASVKWQVPVVAENLTALISGKEMSASFNGYTSCPMVSGYGRAMLIEFDYDGNLTPSFPFIDPLKELWVSWTIEEQALKPAYLAMLRGHG
ncbi:NAD(P)/FAD-dependent oxidoreductase [Novispirillum sp. DQ9]|uniref:NAD(P)/FAD-dependent oxidoreductase n=1 Tax=Novispirillum sp. DQ9 TaxID=3398612 RepID=UPI003C7B2CBD